MNSHLSVSKDTGCSVSEEETSGQKCEVCECNDPIPETGSVSIEQGTYVVLHYRQLNVDNDDNS